MKLPQIFIPEKSLENSTNKLLTEESIAFERQHVKLDVLEIEPEFLGGFYFEESLKRLKEAGYDRHFYPWEYFSLLIGHFEGKLGRKLDALAKSMLYGLGGWLSVAVERYDDTLVCYADPQNVKWASDAFQYTIDGAFLRHRGCKEFDVKGIPSEEWVDLGRFKDDFVEYFYTRKFEQLPIGLRRNAKVCLPLPDYSPIYAISTTNHYGTCESLLFQARLMQGSRGVRKASSHKRRRL